MQRIQRVGAVILAVAALGGAGVSGRVPGEKLHVEIEGGVSHYINEVVPLHVTISDDVRRPVPTQGLTIRWETNQGCFTNCRSVDTFFIERGYSDADLMEDRWQVTVWRNGTQVSVSDGGTADSEKALGAGLREVSAPAVSPRGAPAAVDPATEMAYYQSGGWGTNVGDPGPPEAEFVHEIYLAEHAPDRDARVEHFRKALALRPDVPGNIVLEFNMAVALEQQTSPGQPVRPDDASPIFKHIVEHYDHKLYHRSDRPGNNSNAPDMLVVRSAILLSELTTNAADAEGYLKTAMSDLDWTFRTRKQDLLNAPPPSTAPSPFDRPEKSASRYAAWEKKKADAAADRAVGPYEITLATTAVRTLLGRHESDAQAALQDVVDHYQGPLVAAALAEAAARHLTLNAPSTAPAQVVATVPVAASAAGAVEPPSKPASGWIIALGTLGGAVVLASVYLIARRMKARG